MILKSKTGKYMIGMFGRGTLSVSSEVAAGGPKPSLGVSVTIQQCKPSVVGAPVPESHKIESAPYMSMFFNSVESIDVVIKNLEWAKQTLQEMKDGKEIQTS